MVGRETNILKRPRPAAARISDPSVLEVASDASSLGERRTEVANVLQVICRTPETTVDHEQEWEGPLASGKAQLCKLMRSLTILDTLVERRRLPVKDATQALSKMRS